ncbi:tetratricopeptide-like helical domain-containing protein [Artemisia annua]|uniref:Tetratricopeptide-like helical domain-containing protein n=1 Tax=Artemisia annua TaxID=35608 RepID=A0A2U1PI68_ARTAN|nr:tetratricopeptide-like helical domain-containing protein [Artemisia annua]
MVVSTRRINYEGRCYGSTICGEKKVKKIVRRSKTKLQSLSRDLLVDVLGRVAASSFTDVFNAKLSCQDFLDAVEDDYIFQNISMEKFQIIPWFQQSDSEISFLTNCLNKGNPEALFRQGVRCLVLQIEYFQLVKVGSGLRYLKMAAEKGHPEATYVYGMIMLARGGEPGQQALSLLNSMYSRLGDSKICECREKFKSVLGILWVRNKISVEEVNFKCQKRNHVNNVRRMNFDEDEEILKCDSCMWSRKLNAFCKFFK